MCSVSSSPRTTLAQAPQTAVRALGNPSSGSVTASGLTSALTTTPPRAGISGDGDETDRFCNSDFAMGAQRRSPLDGRAWPFPLDDGARHGLVPSALPITPWCGRA